MTVSRPVRLRVGDQVSWAASVFTVSALTGAAVALTDVAGEVMTVPVPQLLSDPSLVLTTPARPPAPLANRGVLEGLPADVVDRALWWEGHLLEVLTGATPGSSSPPRPEFDPLCTSLRQRELAKLDELCSSGEPASLVTLGRMRRRYQRDGLLGLVDGRTTRVPDREVDSRLLEAIATAVAGETDRSTGTISRLRRRVERVLATEHDVEDPASLVPPRSTFYRLVAQVAAGRHTFGSASTRRSLAQRPEGPFGAVTVLRPGEWVHIDSTPLDVRVLLDDGTVDRAELTWMIDIATRSIPAAVLRPSTKAVDASLLLARAVTPEPMRPGWVDALRMSRSVLPYARLVEIDQRLEHAAARPVIVPETIVIDHGMVYLSEAFRVACRAMGITVQPTHTGSPWEKGVVERSFGSVATLFSQHVAGYVGRSVDRRGKNAERGAAWSIVQLQDLLDEWIVAHWQNRPHDGLRHPLTPGRPLTPNEQYAALLEVAGYVPVPLSADDYIELLPVTWRVINAYGVKVNHRTYDAAALNPYRRQPSGVTNRKDQWEVHYDPYDVTRIWVRNHRDGGWITAPWTHLKSTPTPFGEQAWASAQRIVAGRGADPTDQAEIAHAVTQLLDRAGQGPAPARDRTARRQRRVAARTRATSSREYPRPDPAQPDGKEPAGTASAAVGVTGEDPGPDDSAAVVVPLGVFDAHEEASRWW